MWLLFVLACKNPLKDSSVPAECDPRLVFYTDADGDGVGDANSPYLGCNAPSGFVEASGDCNDSDASVQQSCSDTADTGDTGPADSGHDTSGTGA